jgi:hypothetical protein
MATHTTDYIPNVFDGFFCGECKRSLCDFPNERCCRQSWRDKTYTTKKVVVRIEEENPFADGSSCRECGTISYGWPAKPCCRNSWRDENPEILIEAYEGYCPATEQILWQTSG